jgi:hypothetical protein
VNSQGTVLITNHFEDLIRVRAPAVTAVVLQPEQENGRLAPLAEAVETGHVRVRRTVLSGVSEDEIRSWLYDGIEVDVDFLDLKEALISDLTDLVALTGAVTDGDHFIFRLFTEAPRRHCGYHVDTVVPGAPPWGLVRVYNGETTAYVDPAAVTSIADFYGYFGRRERLVRQVEAEGSSSAQSEIMCLDEAPPFVRHPRAVRNVPAGAIVAFTHLAAQEMFAASVSQSPWIHCSPMSGVVRLVVNISAVRGRRPPPRATAVQSSPAVGLGD